MKKINWIQLITIVIITELIGILSSFFSGDIRSIYQGLIKPPFSPPGWLFGIVWPILFLLMSISVYIIYQLVASPERKKATKLYWVQLIVNFLWPIIFFRFEMFWLAAVVIIILDILVAIMTVEFLKLNRLAGLLLVPYLLWLLFATYLNIGVALLN